MTTRSKQTDLLMNECETSSSLPNACPCSPLPGDFEGSADLQEMIGCDGALPQACPPLSDDVYQSGPKNCVSTTSCTATVPSICSISQSVSKEIDSTSETSSVGLARSSSCDVILGPETLQDSVPIVSQTSTETNADDEHTVYRSKELDRSSYQVQQAAKMAEWMETEMAACWGVWSPEKLDVESATVISSMSSVTGISLLTTQLNTPPKHSDNISCAESKDNSVQDCDNKDLDDEEADVDMEQFLIFAHQAAIKERAAVDLIEIATREMATQTNQIGQASLLSELFADAISICEYESDEYDSDEHESDDDEWDESSFEEDSVESLHDTDEIEHSEVVPDDCIVSYPKAPEETRGEQKPLMPLFLLGFFGLLLAIVFAGYIQGSNGGSVDNFRSTN